MTPPPAILWRIVVRLSLTTLIAILMAYSWLWWRYDSASHFLRDRALLDQAQEIGKSLSITPEGTIQLHLPDEFRSAYDQESGDHRFGVRDHATGALLAGAGGQIGEPPKDTDLEENPFYTHNPDGPGPSIMFGAAVPIAIANRHLVILVEQSGREFEAFTLELLEDFAEEGGWLGAPFLLAMLLVSLYTVRSSLAPLRQLSEQAAAIGPTSTEVRLPEAEVPREILPLVRAVNSALDRLDNGFRIQREFTADAAHELRTPLAVLRAHIDTLTTDAETRTSLARDMDAMTRLICQLLNVAQVEGLTLATTESADLNLIAVDVCTFLAPMTLERDRMLEVIEAGNAPVVHGNTEAIFNALRNLVENALTQTPAGTTITVRVLAPATIEVEDKGPGVPVDLRDRVFQRFWRAERQKSGAGLGLAIVKRTMEAHGGRVTIADAPGGGAVFALVFPGPVTESTGRSSASRP